MITTNNCVLIDNSRGLRKDVVSIVSFLFEVHFLLTQILKGHDTCKWGCYWHWKMKTAPKYGQVRAWQYWY